MLKPTKSQAIQIVSEQAPQLLEAFRDFQASNNGWLIFPSKLLEMKKNLKTDNYVLLYEDEKRLGISFSLACMGKEAFLEMNEELKKLTPEESQQYLIELTQDLIDMDMSDFEKNLPNLNSTKEEDEFNKAQFEALSEAEQAEAIQRLQFFLQFTFATIHNYFSIMVWGEALTSLVPKAMKGDDLALRKAVKIDRSLITSHPYFIERYTRAQANGEREFLTQLARPQTTPNLIGKISYPGAYAVFAMLESVGWLNDLKHREILDICDKAGLDRYQDSIEDVGSLTKMLKEYRSYRNTVELSMHSK